MTGIERLNMSETGPQITPPDASVSTGKGAGVKPPEQFCSPLYDPKREDYLVQKEGREVVVRDPKLVDPNTKENLVVRRVPEGGGGSGLTPEEIAADQRELERLYTDDPDTLDLLKELSPEEIHDRLYPKSPGQDAAPVNTSPDTNVADAVDDQADRQPNQVAEDPPASSQGRSRWRRTIDWVTRTTSSAHQTSPDQNQPGIIREGNQRASDRVNTNPESNMDQVDRTISVSAGGGGRRPPGSGESAGLNPPDGEAPERRWGIEDIHKPEFLHGPEFQAIGLRIVKDISEREALENEERCNAVNKPRLKELYADWRKWWDLNTERLLQRKPLAKNRELVASTEPVIERQDLTGLRRIKDGKDAAGNLVEGLESIYERLLLDPDATREDLDNVEAGLTKYFLEAKRVGLLKPMDAELTKIYQDIKEGLKAGLTISEIMAGTERKSGVNAKVVQLLNISQKNFLAKRRTNPELASLSGVTEMYVALTIDRFMAIESFGTLAPTFEGGFKFDTEKEKEFAKLSRHQELYWRPTYASYYDIYARTPEQFKIAKESFIQWVRTSLSKSPNELVGRLNNFRDTLTAVGKQEGVDTTEINLELKGLIAVMGGNHSNEQYEEGNYGQFMNFMTEGGEGPLVMIQLIKAHNGKTAAAFRKFDVDDTEEILFSPHGSQGQLASKDHPLAQEELQRKRLDLLTIELIGLELKGYDPRDPGKRLKDELSEDAADPLEDNLNQLVMFQAEEDFEDLYEGYDRQRQEELYQNLEKRLRILELRTRPADGYNDEDRRLIVEFEGKTEEELKLRPAEQKTLKRLRTVREVQAYLEAGNNPNKLTGEKYVMYQEARSAVELAYELYGVMGEKAIRGGGVFIVHRTDENNRSFVDYIPNHKAEKMVQFVDSWTRAKYADKPADFIEEVAGRARKRMRKQIHTNGWDAKFEDVDYIELAYKDREKYWKKNDKGENVFDESMQKEGVKPMMLKVPKYKLNEDDSIARDRKGKRIVESAQEVKVTYKKAIKHPYSRRSTHTYPGYQEETRALVLSDRARDEAELIQKGLIDPEDAYAPAVQRLIIDPTLNRMGKFPDLREREIKIALAAIEESYDNHWTISDELFEEFFPEDADPEHIDVSYNLQDYGGSTKSWYEFRFLVAQELERYARRFRTQVPAYYLRYSSMAEMWGAPTGAFDVFRMMNYPEYRQVGQQAFKKWINQSKGAQAVMEGYIGFLNEQQMIYEEGFGGKPHNNDDTLTQVLGAQDDLERESKFSEFEYNELKTRGRLERLGKRMFVLESVMRTDHAPHLLKGMDIYARNEDGTFKTEIVNGEQVRVFNSKIDHLPPATPSGTRTFSKFHKKVRKWTTSEKPKEGLDSYPGSYFAYKTMEEETPTSKRVRAGRKARGLPEGKPETGFDWEEGKIKGSY